MNRLKLNFALPTSQERSNFLDQYLKSEIFIKKPPTSKELETMAEYLLWGNDSETGLNGRQSKDYLLKAKHSTWNSDEVESLESLVEMPTFNEGRLSELGSGPIFKKKREVFDRNKEIARAGALTDDLNHLFNRIDELDYQIETYELRERGRTKCIREELINRLRETCVDTRALEAETEKWTQYSYLKKRHELVELRREQYLLRDYYAPNSVQIEGGRTNSPNYEGEDILVLPLGLLNEDHISKLMFNDFDALAPSAYSQEQIKTMIRQYWFLKEKKAELYYDFRNGFHLQKIVGLMAEDNKAGIIQNNSLFETFWYYARNTKLEDHLMDILELKITGIRNLEIAEKINKKYGNSYTVNYISTLYCQKIIEKIAECARAHEDMITNLSFPENWKICTYCARTLLRNTSNYMVKTRSTDGYASRCKKCEKNIRNIKKGEIDNESKNK